MKAMLSSSDSDRLQLVVSTAKVGLWEWDLTNQQVHFSPEWKHQLGYRDPDIADDFSEWESRVHPDDLQGALEALYAHREGRFADYHLEYRFRHKDGTYRWMRAQGSIQTDDQGKPAHMSSVHLDITERRHNQLLQQGQQHALELIAKGAPLGETLTSLLRFIEAQSAEMYSSILLLDTDGIHLHHGAAPSLPEVFTKQIDGAAIGNSAGSCGTAAFRKEPIYVEDIATDPLWDDYRAIALPYGLHACWSTPIFNAENEVLGTFAMYYKRPGLPTEFHKQLIQIATHIASIAISRQHADDALKLSERQLSLINRTVSDSVFMLSVDENYNYRFVSVNDAFLATTGLSRNQVIQKRVEDVLPASSHALVLSKYGEAIRDNKSVRWQEVAEMPAGRRVGEVVVTPMFDEGGLFLVGAVRDVTDRERAALEIQKLNEDLELRVKERTAQLLNANKELESFSYSVSHDLRAPLRAVTGFGQIIARRHRASLNEEGQRYIDNIVMASERMGRLVEELLNYSKLGRRAVTLQPVSLTEILRHVNGLFATRVREVRGCLTFADDLPTVQGDLTLLSQVFTNLVENALTYLRPGIPPDIHVTWESLPDHVLVHVADNGIGIPAEHHDKIFNVFQRLHNDDEFPGTGIGLAVVARAMALLGGEVKVESEEGKGNVFTVELPKTEQGTA